MTVRPAEAADVGGVLALIEATPQMPQWGREALAIGGQEPTTPGGLVRRLFVAETDGMLAGFVQVSIVLCEAELEGIAVWPGLQRQGVGRLLLQQALRAARADGATSLRLEVRKSNRPALRMYEAAGLVVVGTRPRYYSGPMEDAVLLECSWGRGA